MMKKDVLVGRQEIANEYQHGSSFSYYSYLCIWLSLLHVELNINFSLDDHASDEHSEGSKTLATLLLTITLSGNASPPLPFDTWIATSAGLDNIVGSHTARPTLQSNNIETTQMKSLIADPLSRTRDRPIMNGPPLPPIAGSQTEVSLALRSNTMKIWASAVEMVKRVTDAVRPIPEVCDPICYSL
jgi:hypothetical protein